jgi:FG-GAP-like repeat
MRFDGSRRTPRWSVARPLLGASALLGGCDSLESISPGECGNGVVEASSNEDCDCFNSEAGCTREMPGPNGTKVSSFCGPPGSPQACRFACGEENQPCPDGWGCGVDQVCHEPTGRFELLGPTIPLDSTKLRCADFDGDGLGDVMGIGASKLDVLFYDRNGTLGTHQEIPSFGDTPAISLLTRENGATDPRADFVFSVGPGMAVLTGQTDRSFKPAAIPSVIFPMENTLEATDSMDGIRFLSKRSTGGAGMPADQGPRYAVVWGKRASTGGDGLQDFYTMVRTTPLMPNDTDDWTLKIQTVKLAGPPAMGNLDTGPEDEVAIAVKNEKMAHVYAPYTSGNDAKVTVSLYGADRDADIEGGPFLVDVDGDGKLDLVLVVNTCAQAVCLALEVAYGKGDGQFISSLTGGQDNTTSHYAWLYPFSVQGEQALDEALPIALGDINGDRMIDVVDSSGIKLAERKRLSGAITLVESYRTLDKRWSEAVIHDFNGDGMGDVLAGSSSASDLTFLSGAGKGRLVDDDKEVYRFNEFKIATRGGVSSLTVGDFDGDSMPDVAFAERSSDLLAATQRQTLSICFGQLKRPPEATVRMGDFDGLFGVETSQLPRPDGQAVAVDDLTLSYRDGESVALSMIQGNGARQLIPSCQISAVATETAREVSSRPLQAFAGRYTTTSPEIAVLGLIDTKSSTPGVEASESTWGTLSLLEEIEDDKLLCPREVISQPLSAFPPDEDLYWALDGLSVDLDRSDLPAGEKRDELVLSWATQEGAGGDFAGALAVLRRDADGRSPLAQPSASNTRYDRKMELYSQLSALDLDGDGFKDIVAIAYSLTDDLDRATDSKVVVFWNSGDGQLAPSYTELTPVNECLRQPARCGIGSEAEAYEGSSWSVTSIAVANITSDMDWNPDAELIVPDAEEELIVLADGGVFVVEHCGDGKGCMTDGAGHELRVSPIPLLGGGSRITTCDVMGDGVMDLAILQNSSLRIFNGTPRIQ